MTYGVSPPPADVCSEAPASGGWVMHVDVVSRPRQSPPWPGRCWSLFLCLSRAAVCFPSQEPIVTNFRCSHPFESGSSFLGSQLPRQCSSPSSLQAWLWAHPPYLEQPWEQLCAESAVGLVLHPSPPAAQHPPGPHALAPGSICKAIKVTVRGWWQVH